MFKERNKYIISFCCQVIIVEISSTMLLFLRIFFVLFICIYIYISWSNSGQTSGKFSCPKENIEIFKNIQTLVIFFK